MGIANATTLLSNNPTFNLNTRSIFGSSHVWNIQTMNGEDYYIDNTWNITRNPNRFEGMLKASKLTNRYTFFGSKTAQSIGHHIPGSIILRKTNISEKDFTLEELQRATLSLKRKNNLIGKYPK